MQKREKARLKKEKEKRAEDLYKIEKRHDRFNEV